MIFITLPAGLTALCLATLIHAADNVCFFPNGAPSSDVPCDPSVPFSMCCSTSTACLASGLCKDVSTNGTSADTDKFIRATCTDPSWGSDVCPPFCYPISQGNGTVFDLGLTRADVHIRVCQTNVLGATPKFCCGFDDESTDCCEAPSALFPLDYSPHPPKIANPTGGLSSDTDPRLTALASRPTTTAAESISAWATPNAPLAVPSATRCDTPSGECTKNQEAVALGALIVAPFSTDPPSAVSSFTVAATSTPASSRPTTASIYPAGAQAASAVPVTGSTSSSKSSSNDGTSVEKAASVEQESPSSTADNEASASDAITWVMKPGGGLSTVALVGIGLGASLAAAGLITIAVYMFARRRLYMKQQKRWDATLKAMGQNGSGAGGGAPVMTMPGGGAGMFAMQTQTADGKPAVVMLTPAPAQQQGMWTIDGASPLSLRSLKDMHWDVRSVSEYSDGESRPLSGATVASVRGQSASMAEKGAMALKEEEPAARKPAVDPAGGRTATWLVRHSIYEMG